MFGVASQAEWAMPLIYAFDCDRDDGDVSGMAPGLRTRWLDRAVPEFG